MPGPPLYAISRSNWSPESAEMRAHFCGRTFCGWFLVARGNWIAVNAVHQSILKKQENENEKYDNSTVKKINQPLIPATR